MKKINHIILLVALFTIPLSTNAAQCDVLTRNIIKTTSITQIERTILTNLFKKEGINTPTTGLDIFKAVGLFQKKHNIAVVETVGPKTRLKINELIIAECNKTPVSTSTTSVATPTPVVNFVDIDPRKLELLSPNGGENLEQGKGVPFSVVWSSKNMSPDHDVLVELLGENLEIVIKSWKVKNTGKMEMSPDEIDSLPIGWFNLRIKHFCNSDTIACAEDTSSNPFVIYPPTGWVAGVFALNNLNSGDKYYINPSQSMTINWYSYTKDFDYYKVYFGNVLLGKEVFVANTQGVGQIINYSNLIELKKDTTKSNFEIQNAYYVKVKAVKRSLNSSPDRVMKEIASSQFGVRQ